MLSFLVVMMGCWASAALSGIFDEGEGALLTEEREAMSSGRLSVE